MRSSGLNVQSGGQARGHGAQGWLAHAADNSAAIQCVSQVWGSGNHAFDGFVRFGAERVHTVKVVVSQRTVQRTFQEAIKLCRKLILSAVLPPLAEQYANL